MKIKSVLFLCITLAVVMYGCKKKSSPPFPLNYTSKMGGIRHWSGVTIRDIIDTSGGTTTIHIDSVYINDTFAISIINDKTIQVPNFLNVGASGSEIVLYYEYDSTNSITFFSPVVYHLTYNYQNNTINYGGSIIDSAGYYNLIIHSP